MSLENMSEEECSPSKFPRLTIPLRDIGFEARINGWPLRYSTESERASSLEEIARETLFSKARERTKCIAEGCARKVINQLPCNGRYSSRNPVRVTILEETCGWTWDFWKSNALTKEFYKQLAKFPLVKVSLLVPEDLRNEIYKRDAENDKVTIVEAKKQPGFQDPNEWLLFPPKDLTTDIVIGVGERLCRMAQIFKKYHHCKSIFVGWDSFEESLCRESKLRNALVAIESEILRGESNLRPLMEMADLPVAKGPTMAENLSRSLSYQEKMVFEFTPGILGEFANIRQNTHDRKKFCILVAGHDHPKFFEKEGLKIVAKAVAELRDGSYKIIFVSAGGQENLKKFEEEFLKWGVLKHQLIIRSPPEDEEELKSWLCEADLAIVPSGGQEFGTFGLAALSSGLPILVHSASGLGEALTDVKNGSSSIVESEDISVWSKAIKSVRDRNRRKRLEEADLLRKYYSEKYSWEEQCGALVEEMLKMASAQQDKTQ